MTALSEKTTSELSQLKDAVAGMIRSLIRDGIDAGDLVRFERAIDDELYARGA